jgi:hypothetical protein
MVCCYIAYPSSREIVLINPFCHRYFYFLIVTSVLTLLFVIAMAALYFIHLLLPIIVMIAGFILAVFWLTGLIKASIELWGPLGSINDLCVRYVYSASPTGLNVQTAAWIQQITVCNLWKTTFALEMIAAFLMCWLVVLAWQVMSTARRNY